MSAPAADFPHAWLTNPSPPPSPALLHCRRPACRVFVASTLCTFSGIVICIQYSTCCPYPAACRPACRVFVANSLCCMDFGIVQHASVRLWVVCNADVYLPEPKCLTSELWRRCGSGGWAARLAGRQHWPARQPDSMYFGNGADQAARICTERRLHCPHCPHSFVQSRTSAAGCPSPAWTKPTRMHSRPSTQPCWPRLTHAPGVGVPAFKLTQCCC